MNIRNFLILAAGAFFLMGCENNMKMQQPKWDWWNKKTVEAKDVQQDKAAVEIETDEPATAQPKQVASRPEQLKPGDMKITDPELNKKMQELKEHREKVWATVSLLQDMDSLKTSEKTDLKRRIIEQMDEWYKPMPVSPPNTNKRGWCDVIIWDFTPDEKFEQAVVNWQKIAENNNVEFPKNVTRRQLLKFIDMMIKTNFGQDMSKVENEKTDDNKKENTK